MSSNGETLAEKTVKSEFLQGMLAMKKVTLDVAQWADQYPTPELQSEAVHLLREDQAESEARVEEKMREKATPNPPHAPDPVSQGAGTAGAHWHAPAGRIGKAVRSIEKVAAWDMVGELEEWMAVKVPPYRAARRVFSWLWMAFGAEAMLATLVSCVMLYGAYVGVRWTIHKVTSSEFRVPGSTNSKHETSNPKPDGLTIKQPFIPIPQITGGTYVAGHKLKLIWKLVGPGYSYKIFRSNGAAAPTIPMDGSVNTAGAIVNVYADGDAFCNLAVMAISPDGNYESELSQPIRFDLKPWNDTYSVEPVAEEPTQSSVSSSKFLVSSSQNSKLETRIQKPAAQTPSPAANQKLETSNQKPSFIGSFTHHLIANSDNLVSSAIPIRAVGQGLVATKNAVMTAHDDMAVSRPASNVASPDSRPGTRDSGQSLVPIPSNIHADVASASEIHLSWKYLGPGYTYNAYTDVVYEMKNPWKENAKPLHTPGADWKPVRGLDFYWLAVTAIDRNGHEGPMSEPIFVKVR